MHRGLCTLGVLAGLRMFSTSTLLDLVRSHVVLAGHPSRWVRSGLLSLVVAAARTLGWPDAHVLLPAVLAPALRRPLRWWSDPRCVAELRAGPARPGGPVARLPARGRPGDEVRSRARPRCVHTRLALRVHPPPPPRLRVCALWVVSSDRRCLVLRVSFACAMGT